MHGANKINNDNKINVKDIKELKNTIKKLEYDLSKYTKDEPKQISNNVSNSGYCYIIQEREFIKTNENVYKIGKTIQLGNYRFNKYPKGSCEKMKMSVYDCHKCEKEIIDKFDKAFIQRHDVGREYYEGNYANISKLFIEITSQFLH